MSGSSESLYRRFFLAQMLAGEMRDEQARLQAYDKVRSGLIRVAATNPAINLEEEVARLDAEFALLVADPDGYDQKGCEASGPVLTDRETASPPVFATPRRMLPVSAPVVPTAAGRSTLAWLAMLLGFAAFLVALEGRGCGWFMPRCHVSDWVAVDNKTSRSIRIPHGLGVVPTRMQLWFSPTRDGAVAFATEFNWVWSSTGNPVNVAVDNKHVIIAITGGILLRGVYDADTTTWTSYNAGFFKVQVAP